MGKRPKRKIVLFLVEGKSDREALQLAIPELYDEIDEDIEVYFPIIRKEEEERAEISHLQIMRINKESITGYILATSKKRFMNYS